LAAYDLAPPVTTFALPAQGRNNRAVGVRTGAGDFIFKTYLRQSDAALGYEQALLTWLAAQGLPFAVPAAAPTRAGAALLETPDGWAALTPYLPGRPVDYRNLGEVEAMGAALARLHQALAGYKPSLTAGLAPCAEVLRQHAALAKLTPKQAGLLDVPPLRALLRWWGREHAALRSFTKHWFSALPRQVIHRDYDPSNTLIAEGRVSGVLDFEFVGVDLRALDVAAALKYTMRWWENPQPWETAKAFCRGYGSVQRLTEAETRALVWLVRVRDAAVTLLRLGPAVAARDGELVRVYLKQARDSAAWLGDHEGSLVLLARDTLSERWQ
jgi:homoserine kinase type II